MHVTESSHLSARKSLLALPSLFVRALAGLVCRLSQSLAALGGRRTANQGWLLALIVGLVASASGTAFAVTPQISAGQYHSLFLKSDGAVWASGANSSGQLGDGTTTARSTPVQVMSGVAAISAGWGHSLFLKADGSVWATGDNGVGQFGDGTTMNQVAPVQVMTGVSAVSAGEFHSLFLKDRRQCLGNGFQSIWSARLRLDRGSEHAGAGDERGGRHFGRMGLLAVPEG